MDTIQFIQDKENISKHEAIKKAQSLISITNEELKITNVKQMQEVPFGDLGAVFTILKQSLYSSSKARAYAESRNITMRNLKQDITTAHITAN